MRNLVPLFFPRGPFFVSSNSENTVLFSLFIFSPAIVAQLFSRSHVRFLALFHLQECASPPPVNPPFLLCTCLLVDQLLESATFLDQCLGSVKLSIGDVQDRRPVFKLKFLFFVTHSPSFFRSWGTRDPLLQF